MAIKCVLRHDTNGGPCVDSADLYHRAEYLAKES